MGRGGRAWIAMLGVVLVAAGCSAAATPGPPFLVGPALSLPPDQLRVADVTLAIEEGRHSQQDSATLAQPVAVPAGRPFTIALVNLDPSVPHNIEIRDESGQTVFAGEVFEGVDTRVYEVPALVAGRYEFLCIVHVHMRGTMVAE